MKSLFLGLLGAAFALQAFAAPANRTATPESRNRAVASVEAEYERLMARDDAAQAEIEKWRKDHSAHHGHETAEPGLNGRIEKRLKPVDKAYRKFIQRHPNHARARLSYGCFLEDKGDHAGAQVQWEEALKLDPGNADACNNLAGRYCQTGPAHKAFELYSKAIELKPSESLYYHNFANALYVLRTHATNYFRVTEQQVFSNALRLYSNAARLDPGNFAFARDWGQTFYALKPLPYDEALQAWTNVLGSASNIVDREEVYLHLARVKMLAGRFAEARSQLTAVTNETSATLKASLLRAIQDREKDDLANP